MHPGTIVTEEGFGHEARRLAMLAGHVTDDIFVNHHRVGGLHERVEAIVNFRLARRGDFVVVPFHRQAQLLHRQHHLGAQILLGVGGGDGKITFLVANFVAEVRHLIAARVPGGFLGFNRIK